MERAYQGIASDKVGLDCSEKSREDCSREELVDKREVIILDQIVLDWS